MLLVTKQSLEKHSTWIAFEIDVASEQTKERQQSFFYPCVAEGATFGELPEKAIRFQAIDLGSDTELDSAEGLAKIRELVTAMIENSNNISPSPIALSIPRKAILAVVSSESNFCTIVIMLSPPAPPKPHSPPRPYRDRAITPSAGTPNAAN